MKYVLERQCPNCRSQSLLYEVWGVGSVWVYVHALLTPGPLLNKILANFGSLTHHKSSFNPPSLFLFRSVTVA